MPDLEPSYHNLTEEDFDQTFNVGSFAIGKETMKLSDLYQALKQTYCGSIGAEYMHITNTEEKRWIQQRLESVVGQPSFTQEEKQRFLRELTAAEGLERYLGAKFPGAKRFSLEGGDALVPMLKELIRHAGKNGTREAVLGMAHRGRLNVLINVLGKNRRICSTNLPVNIKNTSVPVTLSTIWASRLTLKPKAVWCIWRWRLTRRIWKL